jgi:hypothetical protein
MKRLLASIHTLDRDYSKAISLHNEALEAAKREGNLHHQIENLICLRDLYSSLDDQTGLEQATRTLAELVGRTEVPLSQWEADIQSDVSPLVEPERQG